MKPSIRWFAGGVSALLISALGIYAGQRYIVEPARHGPLTVAGEDLCFGRKWTSADLGWTVNVRNSSSRAVRVQFAATHPIVHVAPDACTISVGAVQPVVLTIDGAGGSSLSALPAEQHVSCSLFATASEFPIPRRGWKVHGTCVLPYRIRRTGQSVVESIAVGESDPVWQSQIEALIPLASLTASCDGSRGSVRVKRLDAEGMRFDVCFAPDPRLPAGSHRVLSVFSGITKNGERLPQFTEVFWINLVRDVQMQPPMWPLGVIRLGQIHETRLTFRSASGKPFAVTAVKTGAPAIQAESLTPTSDVVTCTYRVSVTGEGNRGPAAAVTFLIHQFGSDAFELEFPIYFQVTGGPF